MTTTNDTPTPRTDAQYKEYARRDDRVKCVDIDFARQLERELAEALQANMDLGTEVDMHEAHFKTMQEERDAARAELATLKERFAVEVEKAFTEGWDTRNGAWVSRHVDWYDSRAKSVAEGKE